MNQTFDNRTIDNWTLFLPVCQTERSVIGRSLYSRAPKSQRSDFGAPQKPNFYWFGYRHVSMSNIRALTFYLKWFGFRMFGSQLKVQNPNKKQIFFVPNRTKPVPNRFFVFQNMTPNRFNQFRIWKYGLEPVPNQLFSGRLKSERFS